MMPRLLPKVKNAPAPHFCILHSVKCCIHFITCAMPFDCLLLLLCCSHCFCTTFIIPMKLTEVQIAFVYMPPMAFLPVVISCCFDVYLDVFKVDCFTNCAWCCLRIGTLLRAWCGHFNGLHCLRSEQWNGLIKVPNEVLDDALARTLRAVAPSLRKRQRIPHEKQSLPRQCKWWATVCVAGQDWAPPPCFVM